MKALGFFDGLIISSDNDNVDMIEMNNGNILIVSNNATNN